MKVLCVNAENMGDPISIKEGEVYEVAKYDESFGTPAYWLVCPDKPYCTWRFMPISEVDETEFERSYNKQLA